MLADIPNLELPPLELPRRKLSWFVYVVRLPEGVNREQVQLAMAREGIATGRYFAPLHRQPALSGDPERGTVNLDLTEQIAPRLLALPFFNRITESEQQQVADSLRTAIQEARAAQPPNAVHINE
jgi:perosamine synthetase